MTVPSGRMTDAISGSGLHRYLLECDFGRPGPLVAFVLHNPSTATKDHDDPTWRRGRKFAWDWGAGSVAYANAWAGRATVPADLWRMADPVGSECDRYIVRVAQRARRSGGFVVLAWGQPKPPLHMRSAVARRLADVRALIRATGAEVRALGLTQDGYPRHPLYALADTQLLVLEPAPGQGHDK